MAWFQAPLLFTLNALVLNPTRRKSESVANIASHGIDSLFPSRCGFDSLYALTLTCFLNAIYKSDVAGCTHVDCQPAGNIAAPKHVARAHIHSSSLVSLSRELFQSGWKRKPWERHRRASFCCKTAAPACSGYTLSPCLAHAPFQRKSICRPRRRDD